MVSDLGYNHTLINVKCCAIKQTGNASFSSGDTCNGLFEEKREPLSEMAIERKIQILRNKHMDSEVIALVKSDYPHGPHPVVHRAGGSGAGDKCRTGGRGRLLAILCIVLVELATVATL